MEKVLEGEEKAKPSSSKEPKKEDFFIEEDRQNGGISLKTICKVISGTGTIFTTIIYLVLSLAEILCFVIFTIVFNQWGNARFSNKPNPKEEAQSEQIIFAAFGVVLIAYFLKKYVLSISYTWISRRTHSRMMFSILHAKVTEFLQRIPQGSIINRFSNDIYKIDQQFTSSYDGFTNFTLSFV